MNKKNILWIFLVFWLIINLVQAYFTGLFNDEAYYFFYSHDLAWGYYDHPPLIAVFIRLGYLIFSNELGVRLLYILLSLGTILIIHKLSEVKNELLFGLMIFSFMIFQITGFLALPDSVLLFFTALFFLVYKRYSETYSLKDALLLGAVMAGLFYSKYLGILVIFFTVISNFRLLFKRSFWIAVLVTTVLFVPHLLWQYQHDFPSFYYHLVERSHDEYFRWSNFGDFIVGQFGLTNPVLFIPVLYFLIRFKSLNQYDRSLKFTASGILLLPFLLMIKGRVEANWTMAGLVPLFMIAYRVFESRPKLYRFLYFTGGFTLIAILFIRILLIYNYLPDKYSRLLRLDIYGWNTFNQDVSKLAGNRPVVFIGSYQGPSHYIFNTGKEAFSFNNGLYRNNQFDLEGIEEQLQGKEVMMVFPGKSIGPDDLKNYNIKLADSLLYPTGKYRYYIFEKNYRSYNFVKADILLSNNEIEKGTELTIPIVLKNPGEETIVFGENDPGKVYLTYYLLQYGKPLIYEKFEDISQLILEDEYQTSFRMKVPDKPGIYYLKVSIKSGWLPPGINSRLFKIRVR
jgi:4-amino-4-deoxy-L-arabinose transferase-like glycosyltransferase